MSSVGAAGSPRAGASGRKRGGDGRLSQNGRPVLRAEQAGFQSVFQRPQQQAAGAQAEEQQTAEERFRKLQAGAGQTEEQGDAAAAADAAGQQGLALRSEAPAPPHDPALERQAQSERDEENALLALADQQLLPLMGDGDNGAVNLLADIDGIPVDGEVGDWIQAVGAEGML